MVGGVRIGLREWVGMACLSYVVQDRLLCVSGFLNRVSELVMDLVEVVRSLNQDH